MDGSQINLTMLIFLVAAVLVFIKLRSVLGRRTGDEPARYERYRAERTAAEAQEAAREAAKAQGKVVTLPRRDREAPPVEASVPRETDAERSQKMTKFAGGDSALAHGLIDIGQRDHAFDPTEFLRGAKVAYEMIVMAFTEGNRAKLTELLSPEVYEGFAHVIDERAARKETIEQSFVGIKAAEIIEAGVFDRSSHVTVKFLSELITATRDASLEVIAGDPKRVREVTDVWTFARDVGATDPNWKLIATRAA